MKFCGSSRLYVGFLLLVVVRRVGGALDHYAVQGPTVLINIGISGLRQDTLDENQTLTLYVFWGKEFEEISHGRSQ